MSFLINPYRFAASLPTPEMVTFDGTSDYWERGAGLTGISDSQYVAGYLKFNLGTPGGTDYIASSTGEAFAVRVTTGGILQIRLENSGGTVIFFQATTTAIDDSTDHEIHWSYDGSTGTAQLYLDGVSDQDDITSSTGTADLTVADWSVGAFVGGSAPTDMDLERFTLWATDATGFADFDVSVSGNRTAMADHTQAADLGNGSENFLDMYGPPATWNAGTNNGQGGDGTMNGAVA